MDEPVQTRVGRGGVGTGVPEQRHVREGGVAGNGGCPADVQHVEMRHGRRADKKLGELQEAVTEDLELFAVSDLEERIEILQAEIARAQAQIARKRKSLAAADALFGRKASDD